jgi:subtilisin family serine protease
MKLKLTNASAVAAALLLLGACMEMGVNPSSNQRDPSNLDNPIQLTEAGQLIPGKYIVVFKEDVNLRGKSSEMRSKALRKLNAQGLANSNLGHVYAHSIQGFSVAMGPAVAARLANDPDVAYIEPDRIVTINQKGKPNTGGGTTPQEIPYGISRVGGFGDGTGKVAWVIDTGIDLDHPDLKVATYGYSAFTTGKDASLDDGNGHGTHVAGTIAALNNSIGVVGVAAGATVVPVKVLGSTGSGSNSGVIAGVNYVAANAKSGDVANMSLGGGAFKALDDAVIAAASKGIIFALAAGNDGALAANSSPARANGANIYTVSAHNSSDVFASWSNYGNPPVDYCAPGVSIKSTYKGGGYSTLSGTSMASPHVAGILLLGQIRSRGTVTGDKDNSADPLASR